MTENMKFWDAMAQPPKSALKTIAGGRLKGFTDVNPQWRYEAMTNQFGPCGIGWKFTIERLWQETAGEELFAFAEVKVMVRAQGGEWSDPIPGIGGSMLVEWEHVGKDNEKMHSNDEGYKMAVTDALGTAMKMLGVAADVYAGKWDGSKYRDTAQPTSTPASATDSPEEKPYCGKHQCQFYKNERDGKTWWSHKIKGTASYCNLETAKNSPPSPKAPPASTSAPTEPTMKTLGDLAAWAYTQGIAEPQMLKLLGAAVLSDIKDVPAAKQTLAEWLKTRDSQGGG